MKKLKNLLSILIFSTIGGLLGSFAGADQTSKAWRRIVIPAILTVYSIIRLLPDYGLYSLYCITVMSMAGAFSLGYGIPDPEWYPNPDKGSTIGKFWYRIFNKNTLLANIFTRATVGVAVCCSLLSVAILKQNWLLYGLVSIGIIVVYTTISWRNLGMFNFKGKKLLWSEFWTYATIVGLIKILIII